MPLVDPLAADRPLLADGAMGTALIAAGLTLGEAPERWTLAHPERVALVHRQFVAAGADILLTNSFGANARRLGGGGDVAMLNAGAARLARCEAQAAGRRVVVAGCVGPTGDRVGAGRTITEDEAAAIFAAQIAALAEGGADLVWIETMSALAEMRAAVAAAARVGLPAVVTASFHGTGTAALHPGAFAVAMAAMAPAPLAIGANCGDGPDGVLAALATLRAAGPVMRLAAKPNAGLPVRRGDGFVYPVGPTGMAGFAARAVADGVAIVGGCCGTTPAHVAAMRRALDHPRPVSP